jgi:hypothetical protein
MYVCNTEGYRVHSVNVRGEVGAMRVFRNLFRLSWQLLAPTSRRVRRIAKSDYELRHMCLSAWNISAYTGRIFIKFDK